LFLELVFSSNGAKKESFKPVAKFLRNKLLGKNIVGLEGSAVVYFHGDYRGSWNGPVGIGQHHLGCWDPAPRVAPHQCAGCKTKGGFGE